MGAETRGPAGLADALGSLNWCAGGTGGGDLAPVGRATGCAAAFGALGREGDRPRPPREEAAAGTRRLPAVPPLVALPALPPASEAPPHPAHLHRVAAVLAPPSPAEASTASACAMKSSGDPAHTPSFGRPHTPPRRLVGGWGPVPGGGELRQTPPSQWSASAAEAEPMSDELHRRAAARLTFASFIPLLLSLPGLSQCSVPTLPASGLLATRSSKPDRRWPTLRPEEK